MNQFLKASGLASDVCDFLETISVYEFERESHKTPLRNNLVHFPIIIRFKKCVLDEKTLQNASEMM